MSKFGCGTPIPFVFQNWRYEAEWERIRTESTKRFVNGVLMFEFVALAIALCFLAF